MNLIAPLLMDVAEATDWPGDAVAAFLRMIADEAGVFPDDSPDGWLGILMSGLAGVAAAIAVAVTLTLYHRTGYRSTRAMVQHGLAAATVLGLLAFVAYDLRHAALAYLGINPSKTAIELEIRLPQAVVPTLADSQLELHTDRNQTLGRLQHAVIADEDGRAVLRGTVPLDFNTRDRVLILNMPGQAQCEFKLRLAASPGHSGQFGPWHLADRVAAASINRAERSFPEDAFAIRYRVI